MKFIIVFFLFLFPVSLYSQIPNANFDIPSSACVNEIIDIKNNSENSFSYEWDFCTSDFTSTPQITENASDPFSYSYGLKIIEHEGNYFGFTISRFNLFRLEFGKSLENKPSVVDLGDFGLMVNAEDIDIIKEGEKWIGIVGFGSSANGGSLIRLVWTGINQTPTAESLGNFGFTGRLRGINLIKQNSNSILIAPYYNSNRLVRVNFGNSYLNTPAVSDVYTSGILQNVQLPVGLSIFKKGADWNFLIGSIVTKNISLFSFSNGLLSEPVHIKSQSFSNYTYLAKLNVIKEGNNFFALVSTVNSPMHVINLKSLDTMETFEEIPLSNMPKVYGLDVIKKDSRHFVFGANSRLQRSVFERNCLSSQDFSIEFSTQISYLEPGSYEIDLIASDEHGIYDNITKTITITPDVAPEVLAEIIGICIDNSINFNSTSDLLLSSLLWNFGDGIGTSSLKNPIYEYQNPGNFEVTLDVVADNGCSNFVKKSISIYDPPISNFSYPSAIICSNNAVEFINETNFVGPDSMLTYQWNINDEALLNATDTSFSFSSGGHKNITLSASIPGCSSDITKTINIIPGPSTSFSFDGICAYDEFLFTNNTTGDDITGYQWDFGDGYFSSILSPDHRFESAGNYIVNLTASNALGCNSTLQHLVPVRYQPVLNFTNDLACSDNSVTLFDQSSVAEANISERYWTITNNEIGFAASKIGHGPSFQLSDHGQYEVTLIGESNYGCLDTLVRNINVYESPLADFRIENTCFGDSSFFQQHAELAPGTNLVSTNWLIDGKLFSQEDVNYRFPNPGDYEVELYVRSSNLCMDNTSKIVTVNPLPEIDFIVDSYCADKLASVNEISNSPNDPITSYSWLVNGKPISNQPEFFYEFKKADDYSIELHVSTDNNCFTALDKTITIHPSPTSKFDVFPPIGASPLKVQFTDRSKGAQDIVYLFSQYNYESSHEENPSYTYHDIGQDLATQIVENEFGCTDTSAQSIAVVIPVYDIAISHTRIESDNPELKLMVGLQNNGSIIINNPVLEVKIEDRVTLSQKIETSLLPGAFMEYEIDYRVVKSPNEMIDYICFSVPDALGNYIDVNPDDNLQCTALDQDFKVLEPYPNPSRDYVQIPIVMSNSADCDIQITSEQGSIVYSKTLRDLKQGLNMIKIDLLPYRNGIYLISVNHSDFETTRKIVVM